MNVFRFAVYNQLNKYVYYLASFKFYSKKEMHFLKMYPPIPGICCVISCLSHFGRGSHINLGSSL